MDEEELVKLLREGKLSEKKLFEKLDDLEEQGVDYVYLFCKYIVKHSEEYKKNKINISLVQFAAYNVDLTECHYLINKTREFLRESIQDLKDMQTKR